MKMKPRNAKITKQGKPVREPRLSRTRAQDASQGVRPGAARCGWIVYTSLLAGTASRFDHARLLREFYKKLTCSCVKNNAYNHILNKIGFELD